MSDQIHAVFGQEVESGSRSVSTGVVVVEQQVLGSTAWAALAPLLEDLGQAVVDIPIGVDCLPVLERYEAIWPDLEKKHGTICFATLFDPLNFTGGASPGKTHTADCCFVSGSY